MIKTCARCGQTFNSSKCAKYCSETCRREATLELKRASYERLRTTLTMDERYKPVVLTCQTCGAKFTGAFNRKYCSEKCRRASQRELENIRRRDRRRNEPRQKVNTSPNKTLDDGAREAAECNLDYGTYRALIGHLSRLARLLNSLKPNVEARILIRIADTPTDFEE